MGTNYDLKYKICDECGRFDTLHLGKSSGGWKFALQANDFKYYKNWEEMKSWLEAKCDTRGRIYDEYNEEIKLKDFIDLVEKKQKIKQPDVDNGTQDIDGYRFSNYEFS